MTLSNILLNEEGRTSSTLLERLKVKNQEAWRRFFYVYGPVVVRRCRRAGLQDADTEEVTSEVFRAVARKIDDYQHYPQQGSFRAWLGIITINAIRDNRRQQRNNRERNGLSLEEVPDREPPSDEPDPAEENDEQLLVKRRIVELVLSRCSDTSRKAFLRVVIGGEDPKAVAEDLGVKVNAVYLARSHILCRIREATRELEGP